MMKLVSTSFLFLGEVSLSRANVKSLEGDCYCFNLRLIYLFDMKNIHSN